VVPQQVFVARVVAQRIPARVETKHRNRHRPARNGKQILDLVERGVILTHQRVDKGQVLHTIRADWSVFGHREQFYP